MTTTKHNMRQVLESIRKNIPLQCDRLLAALDDSDRAKIGKQKYTMLCEGLSNRLNYYGRIILKWKRRNEK